MNETIVAYWRDFILVSRLKAFSEKDFLWQNENQMYLTGTQWRSVEVAYLNIHLYYSNHAYQNKNLQNTKTAFSLNL